MNFTDLVKDYKSVYPLSLYLSIMDLSAVIRKKEEKKSEFTVIESEFREMKEIYRRLLNEYK